MQPGNVASDPTNQAGQNAAGASGASEGSLNLSTGATVAIIVIVAVVVLLGGEHNSLQFVRVDSLTAGQQARPYSFTSQRNASGQSGIRYGVPFVG